MRGGYVPFTICGMDNHGIIQCVRGMCAGLDTIYNSIHSNDWCMHHTQGNKQQTTKMNFTLNNDGFNITHSDEV